MRGGVGLRAGRIAGRGGGLAAYKDRSRSRPVPEADSASSAVSA